MSGLSAPAATIVLNSDQTDYTFQSGNTYYLTNWVTIAGTATIEGGAVIKYGPYAVLSVYDVDCQSTSNQPAYLTARDDDSVGDILSDSTHVPSARGYLDVPSWWGMSGEPCDPDTALQLNNEETSLSHLRISYAKTGIAIGSSGNVDNSYATLDDVDLSRCGLAINSGNSGLTVSNSRFIHNGFDGNFWWATFTNVVFDDSWMGDGGYGGYTLFFDHCIFANTTIDGDMFVADGVSNQFFNVSYYGTGWLCSPFYANAFGTDYQILDLHAPTAYAQTVLAPPNGSTGITLTGSDPDNDALTYTVINSPAHGHLSGTAPSLTYTPNTGYIGTDSFSFTVDDGILDSTNAAVAIVVDDPIQFDLMTTNYYIASSTAAVQVNLSQ